MEINFKGRAGGKTIEGFNHMLSKDNYSFRIVRAYPSRYVGLGARFVTLVLFGWEHGRIYVDSNLNRYFRDNKGRFYICTNADLLGLNEAEKETFLSSLSGETL